MARHGTGAARAAMVAGAVACLVGCEAVVVRATTRRLTEAGFRRRPADTFARAEALEAMTPHRLLREVREGTPWFVYADPTVTDSLYVGDMKAYARYETAVIREAPTVMVLLHPIEGVGGPVPWRLWDPGGSRR